jgi:hypothetical protein
VTIFETLCKNNLTTINQAQSNLLEKFQTTPREENWNDIPLAVLERDVEELYP